MKKLIFATALVAMLSVGCNNVSTSKGNGTDSTSVQVDSVGVDSLKVDSIQGETPQVEPVQPTDATTPESVR